MSYRSLPPKWHGADYAARRLAEIKTRHYPNGDTIQMISDFEWLIEEVEYLRQAEDAAGWRAAFGSTSPPEGAP
jgi:hypothetical protein